MVKLTPRACICMANSFITALQNYGGVVWKLTPRACICMATSLITALQNDGGVVWQICSLRWLPCMVKLSGKIGPPGPHSTILSRALTSVWSDIELFVTTENIHLFKNTLSVYPINIFTHSLFVVEKKNLNLWYKIPNLR